MEDRRLHRCAVLLAALSLLLVVSGTAVTTSEERPYYSFGQTHIWLGAAVVLLTILLAMLTRRSPNPWTRRCGWIALATMVVQAALGVQPLPQPPVIRFTHALLGEFFFPLVLTIAVCTSGFWAGMTKHVTSTPWSWSLAKLAPFVVFVQVVLGTLFRHGALGLGPHLLGAFVVVILVPALALTVTSRPELSILHRSARLLLAVACGQVLVGFTLLTMEAMEADPQFTILVVMIHTALATLTLTLTATIAILVRHASYAPAPSVIAA